MYPYVLDDGMFSRLLFDLQRRSNPLNTHQQQQKNKQDDNVWAGKCFAKHYPRTFLIYAIPFLYISCKFLMLAGEFLKSKEGVMWLNKTQILFEESGTSETDFSHTNEV